MKNYTLSSGEKTKPIQSQSQTESGPFAYGARDCHSPSGLAMTSISLILCAFVAMALFEKTKPISKEAK
ncbi:MAG TPA: hypothetical protein VMX36_00560 [Sedimentisphaerales bacterium]|nr:hypothetical protein [Sedimentisphaerales bacterium]